MKKCYLCNKPLRNLEIVVPVALVIDEGAPNNNEYMLQRKHVVHLDCILNAVKPESKKSKKKAIRKR